MVMYPSRNCSMIELTKQKHARVVDGIDEKIYIL